MFSKKSIVITIGNSGSIVAFHDGKTIANKLFVTELNDATLKKIKTIFAKDKSAPIAILLDTLDQSYKKKSYPSLRKGDLVRLVKRDMATDGDKESLKNYLIIDSKKATNSDGKKSDAGWDCLFISSSLSELGNAWLEFLSELPNRLIGIYMLPVESFNLLKKIKNNFKPRVKDRTKKPKTAKQPKKNNKLYCLIMQNKVSGVRQVVFADHGIVFTRIVSYDFNNKDFLEKYEQDVYSTFEYLKRLYPNIVISEIEIINIFPQQAIDAIKSMENTELRIENYTPFEASSLIGFNNILPKTGQSCDLLLSRTFAKNRKILKFITSKIAVAEKFFTILKSSHYLNFALILAILGAITVTALHHNKIRKQIKTSEKAKTIAISELTQLKKEALDGVKTIEENKEKINIDRAVDIGKIELILQPTEVKFLDIYNQIKFVRDFNVKLLKFSYALTGFNAKIPAKNTVSKIGFSGDIENSSGDIEDLFTNFDNFNLEVKKNFNKYRVTSSEIPRNIDFQQQYYSFPIDFTISKNQ